MKRRLQALHDVESAWLASAPRGAYTHRAYRTELDRFARFLRSRGRDETGLDAELLRQCWRQLVSGTWHETRQPPTTSTVNQSRRILSAFLRWLVQRGHAPTALLEAVVA